MKNISSFKVVKFFAWFCAAMAFSIFLKSLNHYQAAEGTLRLIDSFTPIERNFPTEIVTSLAAGHKDADSLIKLASDPHENSRKLHTSWLQSVELHRDEAFFQIFLWAAVVVSFIAIALSLERHRCEL